MTKRQLIVGIMTLGFLAFISWALYSFVTSKYPGANDFYQRWRGARAYWVEGRDPYSPEVSRQVELDLYGAPASTDPALDQYPGDFLYPFHTALLIAPLTFMPYSVASAIWMALTGAVIAACFVLLADLFHWRPAPWLLMIGVAWAVTFYPSVRGVFLGQPGTLVVCLEIVTLWALVRERDVLAGVLLAISTIKPQLGIFLYPFLVLWAIRYQRWRFLIGGAVAMGVLLGISFALHPAWLAEWIKQVSEYSGYTRIGSPVWVITTVYLPFLGHSGELAITGLLVVLMLWAWYGVLWKREADWFNWTVALTLTVTHLVLVRTATPHFVVFLIVIVFLFRELQRVGGSLLVIAVMVVLTVGYWWLFMATLVNRFESPAMYVPLPFGSLLLLLLTRPRWQQVIIGQRSTSNAGSTFPVGDPSL